MKIRLDKTDSKVVKSNETYDVIDNTNLNNLVVSKTILHPGKETGGLGNGGASPPRYLARRSPKPHIHRENPEKGHRVLSLAHG